MKFNYLILVSALILCSGCWETFGEQGWDVENVEGLKPIYLDPAVSKTIVKEAAKDVGDGGVMFSYGSLLLVNDKGRGVHVINNADVTDPEFLYFINIPGNFDMSLKGDLLYVDNYNDLVTIRLTASDIEIVNRVSGVIEADVHPSQSNVYFECVDASKGAVIGWEPTIIEKPKCYR